MTLAQIARRYSTVAETALTFGLQQAIANTRLLASAYTMADRAGRELGVDAAELCEQLDLCALIRAANAIVASSIPDTTGEIARLAAVLATLPERQ